LLRATPGDPDAFVTDERGRIFFSVDDVRAWQRELGKGGHVKVPGALSRSSRSSSSAGGPGVGIVAAPSRRGRS
jgi:hypothetical protein